MTYRIPMRPAPGLLGIVATALLLVAPIYAQRGGQTETAATPRAAAAIDLTGYWVSVVTEDWKFRMVTPPRGEYRGVPINAEGRRVADTWDPARDEAAGDQCKAYGAPAIMRVPGRLHITWENDNTLRIETDAGEQTRLFYFDAQEAPDAEATWQGYSVAAWQYAGGGRRRSGLGNLKVMTTQMRPGYVRKNGVPYSPNALLTEYYDHHTAPNSDRWLVVTTILDDPLYFNQPFVTSTHFKKLPDDSGWNPTPCSAR